MPGSVDTRIVQMQFDNKSFERNVKTSEKTLEKFKKHLDFSKYERGLNNFEKATRALTFDRLSDNIQKLTDKFTGLGTVSELILSQIRRGIESTARKISGMINQLSFDQISAGKSKFEEMNKNVQTIIAATGEAESTVYEVLQRLNKYTDMTSYNFTDMANNIGKFTSAGIGLKAAEKEMEGIANLAARSGAGIQEASRAMYNLSQAIGMGKLLTRDFQSLENAGMATKEFKEQLIQAGLAAGTLVLDPKTGVVKTASKFGKQIEVNYQNLRDTLSKGWADRATLEKSLLEYYYDDLTYSEDKILNLTEEQLEKNKKLFNDKDNNISAKDWVDLDGVDQVTDDVKQKILEMAEAEGKLVKDGEKNGKTIYKTAKRYGKQVSFTIDEFTKGLDTGWLDKNLAGRVGIIEGLGEASYKAAQKCLTLTDVFNAWKDQLSTGWMNFWQTIFGNLSESMELFSAICDKVGESFSKFIKMLVGDNEGFDGVFKVWANHGGRSSLWSALVGEQDGLYEGAYGLLDAIKDVGKMISDAFWLMIKDFNPELSGISDEDWLANESYRADFLGRKLAEATGKVQKFVQGIKDFMNEVPEGETKSRFQQIRDIASGVASTALIVYVTVKDIIGFMTKLFDDEHLGPAVDDIVAILSYFGQELRKTGQEVSEGQGLSYFLNKLLEILTNNGLITAVNNFAEAFKKLIFFIIGGDEKESKTIGFWHSLADSLLKVFDIVSKIATPVINFFTNLVETFQKLASGEINFDEFKNKVKSALKTMINSIFNFTPDFVGSVKGIWESIKGAFTKGFSKESINELSGKVTSLFNDFKSKIPDNVKSSIKEVYNNVKNFIIEIGDKIKNFFKPFFDDIKNAFSSGFSEDSVKKLKSRFKTIFDSVKNAIPSNIKEGGKGIIEKIKSFFISLWDKIKKTFTDIFSGKSSVSKKSAGKTSGGLTKMAENAVSDQIDKVKDMNLFEKIIQWLRESFQKLSDYINNLLTGANIDENSPIGKIRAFINNIMTGGDKTDNPDKKNIFDKAIDWIKDKIEKVKTFIQNIVGNHEGDGATLMKFLENINFSKILLAMIGILGVVKIIKTVKSLFTVAKRIINIVDEVSQIPKRFKEALHADAKPETKADAFLKIAIAIGIIAAALIFVGNMHWSAALMGLFVIGVIMAGLVIMVKQLKKTFENVKDLSSFKMGIYALLAIAVSIALLVATLTPLASVPWGDFGKIPLGLIVIIGGLWAVSKMVAKGGAFKWEEMAGLLALAGAIWILIKAIMPFKDITDVGEWIRIFGSLIAMLTVIGLFIGAVAFITKKFGSNGMANLAQLAAVLGAVAILIFALKTIAKAKPEELKTMLIFLGAVLLELAVFVALVALVGKYGSMSGSAMGQLAAVAAAIAILVVALMPLALLNKNQIEQIESTLATIMFLFVVFIAAVAGINKMLGSALNGSGMANLLAVAGSVVLVVLAMLPLALLRPEQLEQALYGVVTIMTALGVFIILANKLGGGLKGTAMAQLLAVAGTVVILVLSMIPLALMDIGSLAQALGAVVILMGGMILMIKAISKLKVGKEALTNIALMALLAISLVALISIFTDSLVKVKDIKWETIASFSVSLIALIVGMAGAMVILSKIKDPVGLLKVLGVVILGIGALILVIAALIPIIMGALASGVGIFESMMSELSLISNMFGRFTSNMDNVSESSLESAKRKFEILLAIISTIANAGDHSASIRSFENSMLMLSNAVSQFIFSTGSIESGPENNNGIAFIKEILSLTDDFDRFTVGTFKEDVAELGEALSNFVTSTGGSIDQAQVGIKLIEDLANQSDNLQKLAQLPLDALKTNIAGLGGALSLYAEGANEASELSSGNTPDIQNAIDLMKAVIESLGADGTMATLPDLPDEGSLSTFGVELATLATAMKKFATASNGLGDTQPAIDLLTFLSELQTKLTTESVTVAGVFKAAGIKYTTLTSFGLQIGALGTSLKKFSESTKEFVYNQNAKDALTFFMELKDKLTENNLKAIRAFVLSGVTVETLTDFGSQIGELGEALSKFAQNVNFDATIEEKFNNAITALDKLVDLQDRLPVIGGVVGWWNGNVETLGTLANDITIVGSALREMSNALSGPESGFDAFDYEMVSNALSALAGLTDIANALAETKGIEGAYDGYRDLTDLAVFISRFTNPEYWGYDPDSAGAGLKENKTLISYFVDMMKDLENASNKVGGFKDAKVFESFKHMAQAVAALANIDPSLDFTKVGENISLGIRKGIISKQSEVINAVIDMVEAAIDAAKKRAKIASPSREFARIGRFMSLGLSKGIDDKRKDPVISAQKLVEATIVSAKEVAKVQSPSKVFIQIGEFLGMGLSIGISNTTDEVAKASESVANTTITAMKDALGIHSPSDEAMDIADMIALGLIKEADSMAPEIAEKYEELGDSAFGGLQDSLLNNRPRYLLGSKARKFEIPESVQKTIEKQNEAVFANLSPTAKPIAAKSTNNFIDSIISQYEKHPLWGSIIKVFKGENKFVNELKENTPTISEILDMSPDKIEKRKIEERRQALVDELNSLESYEDGWLKVKPNSRFSSSKEFKDFYGTDDMKQIWIKEGLWSDEDEAAFQAEALENGEEFKSAMVRSLDSALSKLEERNSGLDNDQTKKANPFIASMEVMYRQFDKYLQQNRVSKLSTHIDFSSFDAALESARAKIESPDIDINPVITPVVDLTNVDESVKIISDKLNSNYGLGTNGGLTLSLPDSSLYQNIKDPIDYRTDLDNIRNEIGDMRSDLQELSSSMRQMKFVFNSGAVVAAIGPEMDEYLGQQGYYSVRGEIG